MTDQQAMHHLMQERMQALEEALIRARRGRASDNDWFCIWYECGLADRYPLTYERDTK